ncbi:MAG: hypothetical protein ACLP59_27955 [Bryobacteraceae bacterium]
MSNAAIATTFEERLESTSGPYSRLGYSTGRNVFDGSELLISMKCYFDGSVGEDKRADTWVTLAGFAAPDRLWNQFEIAWKKMLYARDPVAPCVHMWKLVHSEDPFERSAGWTAPKVESLVSDAVAEIKGWDALRAFSCRVNLSARKRIIKEGYAIEEPFKLCVEMCLSLSLKWRFRTKVEKVWLFFDRGEQFKRRITRQWLANRTPLGKISIDPNKRVWDMIADIQELDMESNPPLHAADMVAWATTRDLADKLGELVDLDQYMRGLVPDDHAVIGEEVLRRLYSRRV